MSERVYLADEVLRRFLSEELASLRRYAMSLTGSLEDADDVVQTTVEKVLTSGLPEEAPKAWLIRVCRNVWIDEIRKRKVRDHDSYVEEGEEVSRVAGLESSPVESELERNERFNSISSALDKLTEEHRVILSMVVVEGLSYAQVASVLDIPVGTVMSRVARARTNLRQLLLEDA
jgi:RNA polymerase sigma-70 factor (ECF subfamily)